jgi:hypothetical protein
MAQPLTIAASKINAGTGKKRRSLGKRFRPKADTAAPLARMQRISSCRKILRDTKRRMIELSLDNVETALSVIILQFNFLGKGFQPENLSI